MTIAAAESQTKEWEASGRLRVEWERKMRKLHDQFIEEIDDLLYPHQMKILDEFNVRSIVHKFGPMGVVLLGRIYSNPIKGRVCKQMIEKAKTQREKALELLKRLESNLNRRLIDSLSNGQKDKFERLVGNWNDYESGNLELHLIFLTRPDEKKPELSPYWVRFLEMKR